jgi:hypothetical protein
MLRLVVLREFQVSPDFTYTLGKMIIISSIEIDVAIMAANGPAMKAVWAKHVSKTRYSRKDLYGRPHDLSNLSSSLGQMRQKVPSKASYQAHSRYSPQLHAQNKGGSWVGKCPIDSEENLFKNGVGIIVTSTVRVEGHDANYSPESARP